jgi:hypothetical protein
LGYAKPGKELMTDGRPADWREKARWVNSWEKPRKSSEAGDRRVAARGRAEAEAAAPANPVDEVTDELVDEKEHDVRQDHRDIAPDSS